MNNKDETELLDVSILNIQRYPDNKDKERKHWCLVCHEGSNIALLINIKTNVVINSFNNDKPDTSYLFTMFDEGGNYVICPCSDNYLYVFDTRTAKMIAMTDIPKTIKENCLFMKLIRLNF